jgi:heme exporter protein A
MAMCRGVLAYGWPTDETPRYMREVSLQVEHLARRYGRRWALADVTFAVPAGALVMVAGHNGSGKSTLFRTLSTAIRPDRGRATVGGFDLFRDREDVRKFTAILSHQSYLYEQLTARENLKVAADHLRIPADAVMPLLERVGMASRADDPIHTYSAGMRKRVAFARVLLQQPRLVLLDEPYGQLDPQGFALVEDVIRELKAGGATILMATHQVDRVREYADLALVLTAGRVSAFGPAREALPC